MDRRSMLRLLGGSLAVPALAGLSAESLYAQGQALNSRVGESSPAGYGPLGPFTAHENQTVDTMAELIIPATDTPGARAARVNEFIALIVAERYADDERRRFLSGLASVDERSRGVFGKTFIDGKLAQQNDLLAALDADAAAARATPGATPHFFQEFKGLTLYGYYTSEIGVTRELRTPMWPGRYDPCVATGISARARN